MHTTTPRRKIYLTAGIALAIFSSCSKSAEEKAPAEAELTFNEAAVSVQGNESRSYSNYTGTFNVYRYPENGYTALTSTFSRNAGVWSGNPRVLLSPSTTSIVAWAPAGLSPVSPASPSVFTLTPRFYSAAADLVFFRKRSVNSANAAIGVLQLDRAWSQITLKLTTTNYPGLGKFTKLTLHGLTGASTINIEDGTVTPGPAADLDLTGGLSSGQVPASGMNLLAVPDAAIAPGTLQMSCVVDGRTYNNLNITGITELAAARNYVVNMTLTGKILQISDVKIEDWNTVGNAGSIIIQ